MTKGGLSKMGIRRLRLSPPIVVGLLVVLLLTVTAAVNRGADVNFQRWVSGFFSEEIALKAFNDGATKAGLASIDRKDEREEETLLAQKGQTFWSQVSALISGFASLVAIFGVMYVKRTLDATKDAVKEAAESNRIMQQSAIFDRRAWIDIDEVRLTYPTMFLDETFSYRIEYRIKNVGRTLARNLEVRVETYFARDNPETFVAARDRLVSQARNQPIELGSVVFPGQEIRAGLLFGDVPGKFEQAISVRPDNTRKFEIEFFITATYRIEGETEPRVTQIVYSLLNVPLPTTVPEGRFIDLVPIPFLSPIID